MSYSIINCTPHVVSLQADMFDGEVMAWLLNARDGLSLRRPAYQLPHSTAPDCYRVLPSQIRLACDAHTTGPALGCSARYDLSDEAEGEAKRLMRIFAQEMGHSMIVVASEISVRALDGRLYDEGAGTPIVAMWPVLAAESLRLPMGDRWADRLATIYQDVHNPEGMAVGHAPAHKC